MNSFLKCAQIKSNNAAKRGKMNKKVRIIDKKITAAHDPKDGVMQI